MTDKNRILETETSNVRIVRTFCDRCHCECGVLVHVEDEKVVKIEGDPDCPVNEGAMCPKGAEDIQCISSATIRQIGQYFSLYISIPQPNPAPRTVQ